MEKVLFRIVALLLPCAALAAGDGAFVRVVERDGRWTALDTNGVPFTILGVDHVHPWGMFCKKLGYSAYGRAVKAQFKDLDAWADDTLGRLKTWGFTALGSGCDVKRLGHRGLYHTEFLRMGGRLCTDDAAWYIRKYERAPCTAFPNVFHPDFAKACDDVARDRCVAAKDDPALWGYFIDNELAWWGTGSLECGLFDTVMKLPDEHSAKQALETFVAGRPVTTDLKRDFLALAADRYFAATTAAIRKYDPNHLVLGCRFAGLAGAHEVVWRTAAKYCDVVTFNCYPWADLDRNVVLDRRGGVPIREKFDALYETVKKPMIVTEWSFPALDTGRPCLYGAGQRFATQAERVRATLLFARTMLALPYFIGYNYFMWVDDPPLGFHEQFKEDSNYGLVREDGTPYEQLTAMFARLQNDAARWRKAEVPKARAIESAQVVSECDRLIAAAKGPADAVRLVRKDGAWTISNDVGLELKGAVGAGSAMVDKVVQGGRVVGSFGGLVQFGAPQDWADARKVTDVDFRCEGTCVSAVIRAAGESRGRRFELAMRVTVAPGERGFACEIVEVKNAGTVPLEAKGLFLRPFAAPRPEEVRQPPGVWKSPVRGYWRLPDGTQYGVESTSPDAKSFSLWLDAAGGQHPDVVFRPPELSVIKSGARWRPARPLSAMVRIRAN